MEKKLAKRIKKITPVGGSFDLQFSMTTGSKPGQIGSTLTMTLLRKAEEGKAAIIDKRLTVSALADSINEAQSQALNSALTLLGV